MQEQDVATDQDPHTPAASRPGDGPRRTTPRPPGALRYWHRQKWANSSKIERVDAYSHLTMDVLPWFLLLTWSALPTMLGVLVDRHAHQAAPLALSCLIIPVNIAQCALGNRQTRAAVAHYLRRGEFPLRRLRPAFALMCLALALEITLQAVYHGWPSIYMTLLFTPVPLLMPYTLLVPVRTSLRWSLVGTGVVTATMAAIGMSSGALIGVALALMASALMSLTTVRPCAWTLSVMWEAENNRDVRARLAVAEERLRFGRDLHDVMGRNLAVIALKSELAVQLARRGRPEAIDQMTEVQRIARESQREVREVVRGYRDAELGAELAGAQGVLTAAGIHCEVTGSAAGLPLAVHSALAWVVRECTTNVLRHSDAAHCKVALGRSGDRVVLTVENDGLPTAPRQRTGSGGTGLRGLRERLAEVEGTLTSTSADGRFRVEATVPAPRLATREPRTHRPGEPAAAGASPAVTPAIDERRPA
ncbi:sensor histidine kinase [Streptomyces sp. NPDC050560]|uniref:sensor histidine kinase n=1 Tax=Streptomyces sp. NPDC050560 TaxID=3365630 RepID=UPI003791987D